jgi:hypothetical protein
MENAKIIEELVTLLKDKSYNEAIRLLDKAKEKIGEVSTVK